MAVTELDRLVSLAVAAYAVHGLRRDGGLVDAEEFSDL
jgi:hypothetical protein